MTVNTVYYTEALVRVIGSLKKIRFIVSFKINIGTSLTSDPIRLAKNRTAESVSGVLEF